MGVEANTAFKPSSLVGGWFCVVVELGTVFIQQPHPLERKSQSAGKLRKGSRSRGRDREDLAGYLACAEPSIHGIFLQTRVRHHRHLPARPAKGDFFSAH